MPPQAAHGHDFSVFDHYMIPFDTYIVETAHYHPSGSMEPLTVDLNHFYNRITIITAYPYDSEKQISIYDREGKAMKYVVEK